MTNTAVLNNQAEIKEVITVKEKASVLEAFAITRYFLPILSTVGVLLCTAGGIGILIGAAMMAIGLLSALTVCPLKLMGFPVKVGLVGFKVCRGFIPVYGVADICAAIFGMFGGTMVGLGIVFCAPAIFTVKKYLNERN